MVKKFVGHLKNWGRLLKEADEGRFPPAYLFYGPQGIGKRLVAGSFVSTLFCQSRVGGDACWSCDGCAKVSSGNHPDLALLECLSHSIKIDEVRALVSRLYRAPLEAPLKVVVIDDAHELTNQASNALLKVLEEPPKATLFILVTPNLFQILPTIRSRCRKLYFVPPSLEEGIRCLEGREGLDREKILHLLMLSDGAPGMAITLSQEPYLKSLEEWRELRVQGTKSFSRLSELAQEWAGRECNLSLLLETIKLGIVREMIDQRHFDDVEWADSISLAQRDLDRNVNKVLVLENLLMGLVGG